MSLASNSSGLALMLYSLILPYHGDSNVSGGGHLDYDLSALFDLQRYNWVCHAVKQILVGREQAPRSRDADGGKSKNP